MRRPPGRLALSLGVNGNAVCRCGHERFYLMVKVMTSGEERLMAAHCAQCHNETPIPISEEIMGRKFQE